MAADNFDLQGWMREQRQGPYTGPKGAEKVALKSSKPKSKTGLNEGLMGMIDLQPINGIMREEMDEVANSEDLITSVVELDIPQIVKLNHIKANYPQLTRRIDNMLKKDELDMYEMVQIALSKLTDDEISSVYDELLPQEGNFPGGEEDYFDDTESQEMQEGVGEDISSKWDLIPGEEKEDILDSVDFSEEGLADYAYMGWKMIPEEVRELITDKVMAAKVTEPEPDEDEKIAAMAMKQAKKGAKAVKGLNPDKDIFDILHGTDDEDIY